MEDDIVKKTQDTLGKIIKKPPLTDKLLRKPPFRFLHDIFTEVIRTTGFLKGLFNSAEMDSKNVISKEDKITFLQKIIDCVSIVTGDRLSTKPTKIVTGHEPEKTNELLQAIAKCIRKNLSSDEAVQLITTKKSNNQDKPPTGSSKKKEGKENRDHIEDLRKKRRDKDGERDRDRSSDSRRRSAGKDRDKESGRDQGAGEGTEEKERSSRQRNADKSQERTEKYKEERSRDKKEKRRREENESKENEEQQHVDNSRRRKKQDDNSVQDSEDRQKKNEEDADSNVGRSSRPPRPASAKGHRRRPTAPKSSDSPAQEGGTEESLAAREPSSKSRPARPPSARPAAPRVRQRPDAAEEEIARMESASHQRTAPIIVDHGSKGGDGSSTEDEDEQFLVQEEVQPPEMETLSPVLNGENNEDADADGQHGGLVKKILETKKELETSAAKGHPAGRKRTEIERSPVIDVQRKKERELVRRDIEKLRESVQTLCRSAVPLGKIIDYIQEDMDSMQNELLQWRKENKEHALRLKEEEGITKKTVEPLRAELDELDQSITAQLDMIAASKCNVIRNQEKIEKMVAGVTARS